MCPVASDPPLVRPPGPRGGRFSGNVPDYASDPLSFLTGCARTHGDVVAIARSNYLVVHPRDIGTVLVNRDQSFVKVKQGVRRRSHAGFPEAMMNSEGADWRVKRQRLTPAFARERLAQQPPVIRQEAQRMVDAWEDGQVIDVHKEMSELSLRIGARALFDLPLTDEGRVIEEAVRAIMELTSTPFRLPAWLPTPVNLRLRRSLSDLDQVLTTMVERRPEPSDSRDALSLLLQQQPALPPAHIRDELATLIMSGHETTADALTWTFFALGTHPRLDEELGAAVQDKPNETALVAAVVKESLRLYPPAWVTSREVVKPCRLGGYEVPTGTTVAISQWVTQRDERWFEDAGRFIPGRWFGRPPPRNAYIPFGAGPRACIGASLAMQELVIVLETVRQRGRLRLVSPESVHPRPALALQPVGVLAQVDKSDAHGGS